MYLYFNKEGILKEVINDKALRQGSVDVNKIYVYVEELNTNVPQNFFVNYRLPDGTKIPEFQQEFLAIPTSDYIEVPYNPRRDLKFFKYYEKYPFYEITLDAEIEGVQYNALSQYGSVALTLRVGSLNTLGLVVFDVEESTDGEPEIHWDEYISLAQFNYLLSLLNSYYSEEQMMDYLTLYYYDKTEIDNALSSKVDKTNIGNKIYATDPLGEQTTLTYGKDYYDEDAIVQRQSNGQISVPETPVDTYDATSKEYVDSNLATKQNTLVSGVNIKTINNNSLLGTGNIDIQGGAGTWGTITGDIQDQTDLQNEFTNVREVAEGKNRSIVVSYTQTAPTNDTQAQTYKKPDGTSFTSLSDFTTYINGKSLLNSLFNSQSFDITHGDFYIIANDKIVYTNTYIVNNFKVGDIVLITQTDVPDRWIAFLSSGTYDVVSFYKLETTKIDLTNYATTGDLSIARYETELMLAPEYNSLTTYAVGDKVVHSHKLYTCNTPITTPETWDSTHWTQVSVASGFVDLDKEQVITGRKTINGLDIRKGKIVFSGTTGRIDGSFLPYYTNDRDLGSSTYKWKDIYLSGTAYLGQVNTDLICKADGTEKINIAGGPIIFNNHLRPKTNSDRDLGTGNFKWNNIYLAGKINDNLYGSGYGLTLPDTTNFTANKEIATTDQLGLIDYGTIDANTPQTIIDTIIENGGKFIIGSDTIYRFARTSRTNANNTLSIKVATTGEGGNLAIGIGDFNNDHSSYIFNRLIWSGVAHSNILDRFDTYKLKVTNTITDGTNSATVADIANGIFNVINASDITNNTLTQAQYDLITNGKPTLIKGVLFSPIENLLLMGVGQASFGEFDVLGICSYATAPMLRCFTINTTSKVITMVSETSKRMRLQSISILNGKNIPDYPSSTGTFNIQCVNGTLAWNEQWYGTQAEYDALGTYDSNTTYYILES